MCGYQYYTSLYLSRNFFKKRLKQDLLQQSKPDLLLTMENYQALHLNHFTDSVTKNYEVHMLKY